MEQLAVLVLNGEGNKLMGKTSSQPDIQAFLENVPVYMVRSFLLSFQLFLKFWDIWNEINLGKVS